MGVKEIILKNLNIDILTETSLRNAIANNYNYLNDEEKRRIACEVALNVIHSKSTVKNKKNYNFTKNIGLLTKTKVLGVNHAGPLDITISWKTTPKGILELSGCRIDAGGDQINVSKVFSNFNENIALIALSGEKGDEITHEWEKNFLHNNIIASLIRLQEKGHVAIINIVDDKPLPGMYGWADELSKETVEKINQEALNMLDHMFKGNSNNIWMVLSAGGPVRYNSKLAYYASLVKNIKHKYNDKVELLFDFKFMSGPEEALSVLNIHRDTPQDIIKPNFEEFIQILDASGLLRTKSIDNDEKTIKEYAIKLREKYNLLGVLVTLDKHGIIMAMQDRIIKEKGIKIQEACHTAAGDSFKAGFVYALSNGKSFEEAVHTGNLFGASTASMEGSLTVTPEVLAKIENLACEQKVISETEYLT